MISKKCIFIAFLSLLCGIILKINVFDVPPMPDLEDTWWGYGSPNENFENKSVIRPFNINVSDKVLNDLRYRLKNVRGLTPPLEGIKQEYGINSNLLNDVLDFWKTQYDWRKREAFLNQFPQYTISVQGLNIHYLHVKPQNSQNLHVFPLLILHGWPGSVREFYELIPKLITPSQGRDYVFEIIAPSLPGFGFSDAAVKPGLGAVEMAVLFKNMMQKLGFQKYYLQGGDWGAFIVQHMATMYPEHIIAVHSNMCFANTPMTNLKLLLGTILPNLVATEEESEKIYPLSKKFDYHILETGYLHMQASKPDTLGVGLTNSPAGLAAYILEKFITLTNPNWRNLEDGGLTKVYSLTSLIDNIMIYWVTNSITTSMRIYSESLNKKQFFTPLQQIPVMVPSGCARFSYEVVFQSESMLREKYHQLIYLKDYTGGHFAAMEQPETLAKDIFEFVDMVIKKT